MPELTDILLYLRGEASTEIREKVQQWLESSPDATQELADLESIHLGLVGLKEYRVFDTDNAWDNFETLIEEETTLVNETTPEKTAPEPIVEKKNRTGLYTLLSFLFIALVGFLIWFIAIRNPIVIHQSYAEVLNIILPDQSKVTLQPESTLSHLKFFRKDQPRIVTIDGQAEFDVVSDSSRSFVAETEASAVKVLGTVFILETEGTVTTVENKEGLIRFFDIEDDTKFIDLKVGEKFTYDGTEFKDANPPPPPPPKVIQIPKPPPPKTEVADYSIETLINLLSDKYPNKFVIASGAYIKKKDMIISIDVSKSLDEIISQLDDKSSIKYNKSGNQYEIYHWFN